MKSASLFFGIFTLLSLSGFETSAQQPSAFSGTFSNAHVEDVAAFLQEQGYQVFYDGERMQDLVLSLTFSDLSVEAFLDSLLVGSDVSFAIDSQGNIFLLAGHEVQEFDSTYFFSGVLRNDDAPPGIPLDLLAPAAQAGGSEKNGVVTIGNAVDARRTGTVFLTGHIRAAQSGEPLAGATIYIQELKDGTIANEFGEYSLRLPRGKYTVSVNAMGMEDETRRIAVFGEGKLDFDMREKVSSLREVVIESDRNMNVEGRQMGFDRLEIKSLKQVLAAMGEVDLFRVALTLPGVQTAGEGTTGLNVRGGNADQNLILFNDAVVYNPSHFFGFFTAFNPDVIRRIDVLKSGIPSELGGRLSSVVEISSRDGNKKQFAGSGGIGLLTGRLSLEGPIIRDKTSFMVGARSTYSNWLLQQVPDDDIRNSQASFYDLNFQITHSPDDKNSFYVYGYLSGDAFKLQRDTLFSYRNSLVSMKWKHVFSNKLHSTVNVSHTSYRYALEDTDNPVNAFDYGNSIAQTDIRAELDYLNFEKHVLRFGIQGIGYDLSPGTMKAHGNESLVVDDALQREQAIEGALYVGDDIELNGRLSAYAGIRYSLYSARGQRDVYLYSEDLSRHRDNIVDTVHYAPGESHAFYHAPELRFSMTYILSPDASLKASYNRMRQYLQTLSNTTSVSPMDVWKLSDRYIRPQVGDQVSVGFYRNFNFRQIETSIEAYYKDMSNAVDYKDGAKFVMNHTIEADVVDVEGKAYGVELMAKKKNGKLNGWVNYTFSRSLWRTKSDKPQERVNDGRYYPSNFDKPHAINVVANYRFTHRVSISLNGVYTSGRPVTLPIARFNIGDTENIFYSRRNEHRVPDYWRLDLSINLEGNHKIKKLAHSSWTFGVYNVTGRRNVYSVFFRNENGRVNGYKMSVFGSPIPTITYNFRF